MKSLAKWLTEIEAGHPTEIDMGLCRCNEVAQRLNIDFKDSIVITVAGTNGKGTTCRLIEQVCSAAGLSVGVYSSPHILRFNERIRMNGIDSPDDDICEAFASIDAVKQTISLTYFEYATLAAMHIFSQAKCQVVILEVGLGGRLDATNIVDADINILTTIALDHQDYLGNTLDDIAREKAGIIKADKLSVIGFAEQYPKAEQWLLQQNNQVLRRDQDFSLSIKSGVNQGVLSFSGKEYQYCWHRSAIPAQNVITAIAALWQLSTLLDATDTLSALLNDRAQMQQIIENTKLAGRAQIVAQQPLIMLDVAHNEASADYLVDKIRTFDFDRCHIVAGMLKDKNIEDTLASLSRISANWYCASLPGKRGQDSSRLLAALANQKHGADEEYLNRTLNVGAYESISEALSSAVKQASNTDMIVVVGSFVSVAEAMNYLNQHPRN